jgi:hypothetical protein
MTKSLHNYFLNDWLKQLFPVPLQYDVQKHVSGLKFGFMSKPFFTWNTQFHFRGDTQTYDSNIYWIIQLPTAHNAITYFNRTRFSIIHLPPGVPCISIICWTNIFIDSHPTACNSPYSKHKHYSNVMYWNVLTQNLNRLCHNVCNATQNYATMSYTRMAE